MTQLGTEGLKHLPTACVSKIVSYSLRPAFVRVYVTKKKRNNNNINRKIPIITEPGLIFVEKAFLADLSFSGKFIFGEMLYNSSLKPLKTATPNTVHWSPIFGRALIIRRIFAPKIWGAYFRVWGLIIGILHNT